MSPLVGRIYGPYTNEVGTEKIREYAYAVAGLPPTRAWDLPVPEDLPRAWVDDTPLVAPPTFSAVFAMRPFTAFTADPEAGVDLARLVHGEQTIELDEPVRAGDVLTTTGRVAQVTEKGPLQFLAMDTESVNQHGRVAVRARWTAVVRR